MIAASSYYAEKTVVLGWGVWIVWRCLLSAAEPRLLLLHDAAELCCVLCDVRAIVTVVRTSAIHVKNPWQTTAVCHRRSVSFVIPTHSSSIRVVGCEIIWFIITTTINISTKKPNFASTSRRKVIRFYFQFSVRYRHACSVFSSLSTTLLPSYVSAPRIQKTILMYLPEFRNWYTLLGLTDL